MKTFETVHSKRIHHGRVFDVRQDQIRLPSGNLVTLDIVDHPGAVVLVPLDSDGNIWLIKQHRHAAGLELLELPAGVSEPGEALEDSARRELREEIGMRANSLRLLGDFYIAPGYSTELLYIYLATDLQSDPLPGDEDEYILVQPTPIQEIFDLVNRGEIRDAKTLAALVLALPFIEIR